MSNVNTTDQLLVLQWIAADPESSMAIAKTLMTILAQQDGITIEQFASNLADQIIESTEVA